MTKCLPAVIGLTVLLAAGCQRFGPQADLQLIMPEPPECWIRAFPQLSFSVTFPGAGGVWQTIPVTDVDHPPLISCPKAGNTPILAYPEHSLAKGLLRPAGGLYPRDCKDQGERIELSWQNGCLALIFRLLSERGFDTSLVNAERLSSYVSKHADPWCLDLNAIAEKLMEGDFSAYDIDPLPARDVTLRPGPGEWFRESPFSPTYRLAEGEPLTLPGLGLGMHALFRVQGGMIRVFVGEEETVVSPSEQAPVSGVPHARRGILTGGAGDEFPGNRQSPRGTGTRRESAAARAGGAEAPRHSP